MGKDIGHNYKHSQYQLSTSSLTAPVSSSSDPQTYSTIELTTASVPSAIDKHQNNYVLYSQNTIQNDTTHLRLVNNICVLRRKGNMTRQPGVLNQG